VPGCRVVPGRGAGWCRVGVPGCRGVGAGVVPARGGVGVVPVCRCAGCRVLPGCCRGAAGCCRGAAGRVLPAGCCRVLPGCEDVRALPGAAGCCRVLPGAAGLPGCRVAGSGCQAPAGAVFRVSGG
jgi:hypothetical protein